jgi:catechol 2,3-dioxygenase-like lactoylglutathione lyase family enzyme
MKYFWIITTTLAFTFQANAQNNVNNKKQHNMKLNAGIITEKLAESKAFYTQILGMEVTFENEFYLLLHTPGQEASFSFLLPDHPSQQPLFHKPFQGQGIYLTIEVADVDKMYEEIKKKGVPIDIEIRDESWGDRHFAITDPNGVGIDIVHYQEPEKQ